SRRHTRFSRDWSSDVCSSDLGAGARPRHRHHCARRQPDGRRAARRLRPAPAAEPHMTLLEVKDLSLSIASYPILRDVDLSVDAGEILGVIGESGSGKSMTALSIMQLLPRGAETGGSILLDGEELLGRPESEMCGVRGRDIGMVFQEPMTALNPVKTIGDQVAETVLVHGRTGRAEAMRIARETLDRVEL